LVKLRCGAEQKNTVHIQQSGLFRDLILVLPFLPPFSQWRLTNCGKGPHISCKLCCIFTGRVSRCLHRDSFQKRYINFRRRRITQKEEYNIRDFEIKNLKIFQKNHPKSTSIPANQIRFQIKHPPVHYSVVMKKLSIEIKYVLKYHQTTASLCFIKQTERRLLKLKF